MSYCLKITIIVWPKYAENALFLLHKSPSAGFSSQTPPAASQTLTITPPLQNCWLRHCCTVVHYRLEVEFTVYF